MQDIFYSIFTSSSQTTYLLYREYDLLRRHFTMHERQFTLKTEQRMIPIFLNLLHKPLL